MSKSRDRSHFDYTDFKSLDPDGSFSTFSATDFAAGLVEYISVVALDSRAASGMDPKLLGTRQMVYT
jgi:hypothetical protein